MTLFALLSSSGGCAGPVAGMPVARCELGEERVQAFAIRASRPDTPLEPGTSLEVFLWVGYNAAAPSPKVLRAWIGRSEAADTAKSVASLAPPTMRHHFQVTVSVPDPLPADARLEVEIEDAEGVLHHVGFALRP